VCVLSNATKPFRESRKESILRCAGSTSICEWLVCELYVMCVQAVGDSALGALCCERCLLITESPKTPGHYRYLIWVLVYSFVCVFHAGQFRVRKYESVVIGLGTRVEVVSEEQKASLLDSRPCCWSTVGAQDWGA